MDYDGPIVELSVMWFSYRGKNIEVDINEVKFHHSTKHNNNKIKLLSYSLVISNLFNFISPRYVNITRTYSFYYKFQKIRLRFFLFLSMYNPLRQDRHQQLGELFRCSIVIKEVKWFSVFRFMDHIPFKV